MVVLRKIAITYYDFMNYAYQLQALDANLTTEYQAMKQAVEAALLKMNAGFPTKNPPYYFEKIRWNRYQFPVPLHLPRGW